MGWLAWHAEVTTSASALDICAGGSVGDRLAGVRLRRLPLARGGSARQEVRRDEGPRRLGAIARCGCSAPVRLWSRSARHTLRTVTANSSRCGSARTPRHRRSGRWSRRPAVDHGDGRAMEDQSRRPRRRPMGGMAGVRLWDLLVPVCQRSVGPGAELNAFAATVAACPPLALLLAVELLNRALRRHRAKTMNVTITETCGIRRTETETERGIRLAVGRDCSRPPAEPDRRARMWAYLCGRAGRLDGEVAETAERGKWPRWSSIRGSRCATPTRGPRDRAASTGRFEAE